MPRTPKFNVGKEKLSAQCEPCELPVTPFNVKVRICVFFDGTNNNKYNVNRGKQLRERGGITVPETSDDADLSNIARLSNAFQFYKKKYDIQFAMYVVGAGTGGDGQDVTMWGKGISNDGKADGENRANDIGNTSDSPIFGGGFAIFKTGILQRASLAYTKAITEIDRRIKVFRKKKKFATTAPVVIDSVELDAFGFSRGAATARHFVTRVLEGWTEEIVVPGGGASFRDQIRIAYGFAQDLKKNYVQSVGQVKFVFLGLYDTVASHGLVHVNDVNSLKLNRLSQVDRTVHLCAADEHRINFALTNITSAGSKGVEIFLPGVHSDVGGGYLDHRGDAGTWLYYRPRLYREKHSSLKFAYTFRCYLSNDNLTVPGPHEWREEYSYRLNNPIRYCQADVLCYLKNYEEILNLNHCDWMEVQTWSSIEKKIYDEEQKWLEQSGWFLGSLHRPSEEKTYGLHQSESILGIVSKRNFISNRYSWVTLQIMADFASDNRWGIKFNRAGIYGLYSLAKEPFLLARLRDLQSYIAQKCGPIPTSSGVGQSKWQDWFSHPAPCDKASQYPWLAELRRVYCHFSARIQDGWNYILGVHAPQYNGESRQRRIFPG